MAETTARILTLLSLLQTHRQWPGGELAARLDVTERTLRRDIERLRELGYRVAATRGVAGGYRLEAGSHLPPLLFTDAEAVTLAIGLRIAAAQGVVDGENATLSVLAKFEQVLPVALRERVNALAAHVQSRTPRTAPSWDDDHRGQAAGPSPAGTSPSTSTAVSHELLGKLALACRDHERIRFHYVAADGAETDRIVEPHTIVASARTWFLVCWDLHRDDWRTFRIDRMSRYFGTRVHVAPRELPADDAARFVESALAALRGSVSADVHLRMPLLEMRDHFGPYSAEAEAVDAATTRWPIRAETFEQLLGMLAWIPAGVQYSLHDAPEFRAFVRDASERALRAANSPDSCTKN